jgi:hypothetical protein
VSWKCLLIFDRRFSSCTTRKAQYIHAPDRWPGATDVDPPFPSRDPSRTTWLRNPDMLIFGIAATMTIQVRGRGTLTLPASLREKYPAR